MGVLSFEYVSWVGGRDIICVRVQGGGGRTGGTNCTPSFISKTNTVRRPMLALLHANTGRIVVHKSPK